MKKVLLSIMVIVALCVTVTAFAVRPSINEPCKYCNGRGWNECNMCDGNGWRECPMCGGDGYVVLRDGTKETCDACGWKKISSADIVTKDIAMLRNGETKKCW